MDNIYNIITNLIIFIPIVLMFSILPFLTRKDIMFGVTIPSLEWQNDYFKKLRRAYLLMSVGFGIVLLAANVFITILLSEKLAIIFMQVTIWTAILVYFLLYILFWTKTKKYKKNADWEIHAQSIAVADTRTNYLKKSVSFYWFILYLVLIAGTFFYAVKLFDTAPNMIPVRFDMQGNPLVYQMKSMKLVYELIGMQVFLAALFFGINFTISHAKKTIDPNNPRKSSAQNDEMKFRWSIFLFLTGLIMLLIFTFVLFSMFVAMPVWAIILLPVFSVFVILFYAIVLALNTGQSGSRIKTKGEKKLGKEITRDDDSLWKLGMFYYNKDDPAVFVEKRFGVGWTTNWARWQSWLVITVILAIVAGSLIFSR